MTAPTAITFELTCFGRCRHATPHDHAGDSTYRCRVCGAVRGAPVEPPAAPRVEAVAVQPGNGHAPVSAAGPEDTCRVCKQPFVHHQAPHKPPGVIMYSTCGCHYATFHAPEPFEALLDRSSLGTPEAKAIMAQADDELVQRTLRRADELGAGHCDNPAPRSHTGHWRDWHRGHGCELDPEVRAPTAPLTPAAVRYYEAATAAKAREQARNLRAIGLIAAGDVEQAIEVLRGST